MTYLIEMRYGRLAQRRTALAEVPDLSGRMSDGEMPQSAVENVMGPRSPAGSRPRRKTADRFWRQRTPTQCKRLKCRRGDMSQTRRLAAILAADVGGVRICYPFSPSGGLAEQVSGLLGLPAF